MMSKSEFKRSEIVQIVNISELNGSIKTFLDWEGITTDTSFLAEFSGEFVNPSRIQLSSALPLAFDPDCFDYLDKVPLAMSLTTLIINGQKSCFICVKKSSPT
jgi:hypothetical protein